MDNYRACPNATKTNLTLACDLLENIKLELTRTDRARKIDSLISELVPMLEEEYTLPVFEEPKKTFKKTRNDKKQKVKKTFKKKN